VLLLLLLGYEETERYTVWLPSGRVCSGWLLLILRYALLLTFHPIYHVTFAMPAATQAAIASHCPSSILHHLPAQFKCKPPYSQNLALALLSIRTLSLIFASCLGSSSSLLRSADTILFRGTITVTNLAPVNGTCQTPPWVGIHDGSFDTYDSDRPIPEPFQHLAEDGNSTFVMEAFAAANGTVWDGSVGDGPICPGEIATLEFQIEVQNGTEHYFSYASMVLPSNDAWVANGNPEKYTIFDEDGAFVPLDIVVMGSDVLDAGTEVNDEIPVNTAFLGQSVDGFGDAEDDVVIDHPGFNPVGSGGILDDPRFVNADFTADDYKMMSITVEMGGDGGSSTTAPSMAPASASAPTSFLFTGAIFSFGALILSF